MKKYLSILIATVVCASAHGASLLPAGEHDQIPAKLVASKALAGALDRAPVSVSHAVEQQAALDAAPAVYTAQSREFWTDVDEGTLRAGVKLTTTAPGALVRLSPRNGAPAALDAAGVLVRANGRTLSASDASAAVADAKALRSAGLAVPEGTLAFRLNAGSGSGPLEIAAPHAQGRYLVHVFEPASTLVLRFSADRDTVLAGSSIVFHAALADGDAPRAMNVVSGLVTAPDGYSADLAFTRNRDGSFTARFTPDAAHTSSPQLWEAHVFSAADAGSLSVLRDAKTAFAVSAASARFGGDARIARDASGLRVSLDVSAASASRYQVSAVLYGTGADGALHAASLAQSAAWLGASGNRIELRFDNAALGALHAPFELRDLRLLDQANMAVIERRERGLVVD